MDNPFTPGNGVEPSYLAGRAEYLTDFIKSLKAVESGLPRNMVVYGLRGTGKTVLLRHYKIIAESNGWLCIDREFIERYCDESEFAGVFGRDLATLASEASIKRKIAQAGKRLFDFLKPEELSAYGIKYKPYYSSQNEALEDYLADLLKSNWPVFEKAGKKGVVLLYDEFHAVRDKKEHKQYVLSSVLSAFSKLQREGYNYYLCLSGLPPLKTNLKEAKTYTERMFSFQEVENLLPEEAKKALLEPLKKSEYKFQDELANTIVKETKGYPYFIQFYGYFLVDTLNKNTITLKDFQLNRAKLLELLDKSFFEDRFKLASQTEKKVLIAMAKCPGKEIPAAEITQKAKMTYPEIQNYLIRLGDKGLIYRAQRGQYAFSIPLFREYLLRQ